jgi:hypothetical protein
MIWDNISVRMTYDTTIFPDEGAKTTYMVWREEDIWNVGVLKKYAFLNLLLL